MRLTAEPTLMMLAPSPRCLTAACVVRRRPRTPRNLADPGIRRVSLALAAGVPTGGAKALCSGSRLKRRHPGNPAADMGAVILIVVPEPPAQRRLLIKNHKSKGREPSNDSILQQ